MYFKGKNIPGIGCCGEYFDRRRREIHNVGDHEELYSKFILFIPVAYRGGEGFGGVQPPPPRNSEGPPKSCQNQTDCENC